MDSSYNGQWTGSTGSGAYCIVNINDNGATINGRVSLYEDAYSDPDSIPVWTMSFFEGGKESDIRVTGHVRPATTFWANGNLQTLEERAEFEKRTGIMFPEETNFSAERQGLYKLKVNWNSKFPNGDIKTDDALLEKKRLGSSKIFHQEMDWDKFKSFASSQNDGFIFRGQSKRWRLQTTFHRTGHADIITYLDDKVPELERHINAFSNHEYDFKDDRSLGGLLNLAQHHGYPTPLLDWTKSPFVAAFFAFENAQVIKKEGTVSVFCLNDAEWSKIAGRQAQVRSPKLSVKNLELPGFGNQRVLPQQSITMFSNAADVESIVQSNESFAGQYLTAIAIPSSERERALRDLHLMGITWGSMFPGIEGVCKQLASRHFGS